MDSSVLIAWKGKRLDFSEKKMEKKNRSGERERKSDKADNRYYTLILVKRLRDNGDYNENSIFQTQCQMTETK